MSARTRNLYGVVTLLIALLLITSTVAAYYYTQYSSVKSDNATINTELESATAKYGDLATRYNKLLSSYNGSIASFENLASVYNSTSASFLTVTQELNLTLSLLVTAVSNLNTSSAEYAQTSQMISHLWKEYILVTTQYKQLSSSFDTILVSFEAKNNVSLVENLKTVSPTILVSNIVIDLGNGTVLWYNSTSFQPGWNLYVATLVVTNNSINATWYPTYGEHLISGIYSVVDNNAQNKYWFYWTYNSTSSSWQVPQVGADDIMMTNGTSYAWTYCTADASFNPTCTPP